ncbi:MAG: transcriptional repressor [Gemmatimonadetes bacterium]|nr:transcriptional repressor [Gemmatimonadota bacterium]MCH8144706.1 transcriptional repressor [Gemmatimonadota bacterium]MCH8934265.1 transcriptional repressor [Gemmatimonadota bacterium]
MTSPPPKLDAAELVEGFRGYMRDHNLPLTHQREAIASALFHSEEHLSVEDIEAILRDENVHVGKATVYRTLDLLVRAGLVDEHDFGEGFKRFEPRSARSHHEHLICLACGKVVEFTSERIERMKALIADEHGFRHHHHRLDIYGVCSECQGRAAVTLERSPDRPGGGSR